MSVFDFIRDLPLYADRPWAADRLAARHRFCIEPHLELIRGARVLDLGSHDGRWPYAIALADAREVVGIEARGDLMARFADFPDNPARNRVRLIEGEIDATLSQMIAAGEQFDIVAVLGVFYHLTSHYRLLDQIRRLGAGLVIIDGEFLTGPLARIELRPEDPALPKNAPPAFEGQRHALAGIPSRIALELMANTLGYRVDWMDWSALPPDRRDAVRDYFNGPNARSNRGTCALRR